MGVQASRPTRSTSSPDATAVRRPPKITQQDRAVLDLKLQRDKLRQYQTKLANHARLEHDAARQALARGDKSRALTALRRKRYQETLLERTDTQLETLQGLVSSIEFSQIQVSVLQGLKQGNAALKEIHRELNLDNVQRLMDETERGVAYQREIDEMLTSHMTAEDEEAVAQEMASLEAEATGRRADVAVPSSTSPTRETETKEGEGEDAKAPVQLPSAPQHEPAAAVAEAEAGRGEAGAVATSANRTREQEAALRLAAEEPLLA